MVVIHRKAPYQKNKVSFLLPLFLTIILILIIFIFFSSWLKIQENTQNIQSSQNAIFINPLAGNTFYRTEDNLSFQKITQAQALNPISYINTDPDSKAELILFNEDILRIASNTSIIISNVDLDNKTIELILDKGNIWLLKTTDKKDNTSIRTPNSIITTTGNTSFNITYNKENKITGIQSILGEQKLQAYQISGTDTQIVANATIPPMYGTQIENDIFEKLKLKEADLSITKDENAIYDKWIAINLKTDYEYLNNKKDNLKQIILSNDDGSFLDSIFGNKNDQDISKKKAEYYKVSSYLKDLEPLINKINSIYNSSNTSTGDTLDIIINDAPDFLSTDNKYIEHTVLEGEYLSNIALEYNVTIDEILNLNKIDDANTIEIGTVLKIPQKASPTIKPSTTQTGNDLSTNKVETNDKQYILDVNGYYTVTSGDTLFLIGQGFGINYITLAEINNIPPPYNIEIGQKLLISAKATPSVDNTKPITPEK